MDTNQPPNDTAGSMLREIDQLRMAFVRTHVKSTGDFDDTVDPKVGFKLMDDLSKSLARREKQEAENLAEMNMEQHRARALALADEVLKRQRTPAPGARYDLDLPTLPTMDGITAEEAAVGVVKLDLNDYRE